MATATPVAGSDYRVVPSKSEPKEPKRRFQILKLLGPGLITGAADDDPSGIATYSQVGAQFGFQMLWTAWLTFPLMVAIQEISARIGRVTGRGISGNMRRHYPAWITVPMITLLLLANLFNLAADILAMGAALALVIGGPAVVYAGVFALVSLVLQIFLPYGRYAAILRWLTLSLFAYVGVILTVRIPWAEALHGMFLPAFSFYGPYLIALAAVFGTTISPYLFFWQASLETEEVKANKEEKPLKLAPEQAPEHLFRIRIDTLIGMAVSNIIAFFVILTAAVTLHAHGKHDISTASQAAEALRPIAGKFAFLLFSAGIIGTGMMALPVLAGSAAYAIGELFRWPTGMDYHPMKAKRFYGVIVAVMVLGYAGVLTGLDPITALFWSAVINGVVAVPVMILVMLMSGNRKIMGDFTPSPVLNFLGWLATAIMALVAVGLFATLGK